jgi:hypothetical protein
VGEDFNFTGLLAVAQMLKCTMAVHIFNMQKVILYYMMLGFMLSEHTVKVKHHYFKTWLLPSYPTQVGIT